MWQPGLAGFRRTRLPGRSVGTLPALAPAGPDAPKKVLNRPFRQVILNWRHIERPFGVGAQIPGPNQGGWIAEREIAMLLCLIPQRRRSISIPRVLGAAGLVLLAGRAAHAQSTWTNASGGNWSVASNWNNSNVPDNSGESAIILPPGPYTVFFDNNYSINALTIAHELIRVDLQNSLSLALSGGLNNSGVFTINNAAGPNNTFVRINASQTWSGGGATVLNANPGNLDTAYILYSGGGEVLTLASGTSILGSGRIYVSMVNDGGVIANSFGRTLELLGFGKTNNSEFAAIQGGILALSSQTLTQGASASVRAYPSSSVAINSSAITGGKLQTDAGGSTGFSGSSTLTSLSTAGVLDVLNNSEVRLATSLVNDGDIRVNNGSGPNNTSIRANTSVSLDGLGSITLRSDGVNPDTAYLIYNGGGEIVTQGPQHTIRGSGNIYVAMVNNGTISASTPGRSLRLVAFGKTNNKTISADVGRLEIDNTTITQGGPGVISLTSTAGASLVVRSAVINSGLLQSSVNAITIEGTSTFNNTAINGPMTVLNNSEMRLGGAGTTHAGDLFVNSGSGQNNTFIRVMQNHAISGVGRIVLRAHPANLDTAYLFYNGGGEALTQNAGHSIVGTGNIHVALNNAGIVSADQNGRTLQLLAFSKSNAGLFMSQNGGILQFSGTTVTQSGAGTIRADTGQVRLIGTTVNGGAIETINGGFCELSASTTLSGVSFAGDGRVPNNNEVRIAGPLTNNGTLTVNPSAGQNNTYLRLATSQTVSGSGSIVLNAHPANLDTAYLIYNGGGEVLTQAAGHSVRGTGRIYVALTNNGLVSADVPGQTLDLTAFAKTNNAVFEATNSGVLSLTSVNINQAPGGILRSASGGRISVVAANIAGGTIQSASDSLSDAATFQSSSSVSGVSLVGAAIVPNNNEFRLNAGGLTNNGILTINPTAGANGTYLRAVSSATIDGTGSIVLNANPANLDTAYLLYNGGGEALTFGNGQTLAGTGNIYVRTVSHGTVAPGGNPSGTSIGRLNLAAFRFSQQSDGIMVFDISGPAPSQFDRITGGATIDLAGALVPSLINSYDPVIGTTFDIIDGPPVVGTFASVGPGFTVQYFPNKVRVTYTGPTCPADLNHDGVVDDADFVLFVPAYNILDCADPSMPVGCPADMNRDGVVDDIDFVIFLAQYNELICPE